MDEDAAVRYRQTQLFEAKSADIPQQLAITGDQQGTAILGQKIPFPRSRDKAITKATALRAAWSIVLARYSDSDDVCFGSVVSGRNAPVP